MDPFFANPSMITSGDGWTEHISKEGRKYYYNTLTQESQWGKPLSLQTPEEAQILLKTGWQEFSSSDGKSYWFHAATKRSVWSTPKEVEEMLKALKEEREDWPQFKSKDEAKTFLVKLFDLKKFPPRISWENASKILESDRRWSCFSILTRGERKQTFAEYMGSRGKRAAEEERQKRKKAKDLMVQSLLSWKELSLKTTYIDLADRFHFEEWWTWMQESERDDFFQEWMSDNQQMFKDKVKERRREDVAVLEEILEQNPTDFPFQKKWADVKEQLLSHPRLQGVMKIDVLQVWEEWVHHGYEEERQQRRTQIYRKERKRRDAFKELLQDAIDKGEMSSKTEWPAFVRRIERDPRYVAMVGQGGSTPRELFTDAVDRLKEQHEELKQTLRRSAERAGLDIRDPSLSFNQFYEAIRGFGEVKNLNVLNTKMVFEALRQADGSRTAAAAVAPSDSKARSRSSRAEADASSSYRSSKHEDASGSSSSSGRQHRESAPAAREKERSERDRENRDRARAASSRDDSKVKRNHRSYPERSGSRHREEGKEAEGEQPRKKRNLEEDGRRRH
ncbi:hypothetical protein Efla_000286 [Eimeria flavescens]